MACPNQLVVAMHLPTVEPVKRLVGGRLGWAIHRFPIKGGITFNEALRRDAREAMSQPSRLAGRVLAFVNPAP